MKRILYLFAMFVFGINISYAEPVIEVYDDLVIEAGYSFEGILNIYDTPPENTTVEITGGYINHINTYNQSELTNWGGIGNIWHIHDSSTFRMVGGEIGWLGSYHNSIMTVEGGEIREQIAVTGESSLSYLGGDTGWLNSLDSSVVDIDGGKVREGISSNGDSIINIIDGGSYWMQTYDNSTVNLKEASLGFFGASDQSIVNVYGYNLTLTNIGGRGYGYVAGHWADCDSFNIPFFSQETYTHVVLHEIPEPATLSLLAIGAILLRRRTSVI